MLGDVEIDCTERVVEKVHVGVLVDGPRQTHSVSLPAAQVDTLQPGDSKTPRTRLPRSLWTPLMSIYALHICLSRVYILRRPAQDKTSALDTVFPGYTKDTANTFQVEDVESGIRSPCLNAVQQCADDTGVVDGHLCFHSQLGVYSHTSREAGESCNCLSDPLVDRCVQGEVFGDGGSEVCK